MADQPESGSLIHESRDQMESALIEVLRTEARVRALGRQTDTAAAAVTPAGDTRTAPAVIDEVETVKEKIDLREAYAAQSRAAGRLALVTQIFEIGCSQKSEAAIYFQLSNYLFRSVSDIDGVPGAQDCLSQMATALYAYFHVSLDTENEMQVRTAWQCLESVLRELGRNI
ncbi:MAG: hypothetical protein QF797_01330 [Alphaproteobacteria bacterium]|jgi:hypothetical protein|nr:hypothetical protein [Rhodospirillaceae bacterium]MDP6403826.1 hypothetical protein [Alphaproteobacteria bacterium]MDP6622821.1 hypothetical protein [Alphaproteobacteria bacterium]|tara:strand:+ start:926 stop:1438 length:513 start_codon:yes stop_codon:yes gene_type:complete